ncbi:helix-turn-helix transcriptional regulator [Amycolatopsis sp., V23-08]|uniref:Helix-turn-helix transcriptional regulator n=1 Tax=Amycolatopsis heterodermiae TaxID=3110235 RepID=A0ABU5RDD6_9PSEU|nr:helix-turn-helix transcriptional regulator [Amycolatopsis sp., V23-08]MEA5363649.1 helix-turn-helix transcriptional regulator [Amycolatopsis sp., V23-08]
MSGPLEPDLQADQRATLAGSLRELRRAAGLSGERLAARCAMSQAKISRIETGRTLPSVVDVEQIVKALDVPAEAADRLLSLARVANVGYTSWRSATRVGSWHRQREIKALQESSAVVRQFLPAIPSGILQTPEYARAALTSPVPGASDRDVEKMIDVRMGWKSNLADSGRAFKFVLTEQAVVWRRAPLEIMIGQLEHMADLSALDTVDLAVVPKEAAVFAAPLNVFVIYDERLVTVELFSGGVALRDPRDVAYHLELFAFFRARALEGGEATGFLRSAADDFRRERRTGK